jgi:hypothetical protein
LSSVRGLAAVLAVLLVSALPAESAQTAAPAAEPAPATDCDLYAASPRDEERWAPGVEYEKIENAKAIPACEAAVAAYPQEERFRFQLARALDAAKEYKRAAYLYRDLASAGHEHAASNLTEMARQNTRPGPDPHEVKRLEDAANSGDARAALLLATMYNFGIGVSANGNTANALYIKAVELGSAEAMYILGIRCGAGSSQDGPECTRLLEKAANLGSARAMYLLGATLRSNLVPATAISATIADAFGKGLDVTREKAARLNRQAADLGHAKAAFDLGSAYLRGEGVEKSPAEAVVYFRKAAALGHVPAMRRLAELYRSGEGAIAADIGESVQFYRKAASFGDSEATIELALMYRHGQYGVAKDSAEAMRLFRSAAGLPRPVWGSEYATGTALAELASMYANGEGVIKDVAEAVRLYREAADLGNAAAFYELAGMHERGEGVERNAERAARLAVTAIEKKEPRALREAPFADWSEAFRVELQKILAQSGSYTGPIDGMANEALKKAVQAVAAKNSDLAKLPAEIFRLAREGPKIPR